MAYTRDDLIADVEKVIELGIPQTANYFHRKLDGVSHYCIQGAILLIHGSDPAREYTDHSYDIDKELIRIGLWDVDLQEQGVDLWRIVQDNNQGKPFARILDRLKNGVYDTVAH